jgi:hypothetical protein
MGSRRGLAWLVIGLLCLGGAARFITRGPMRGLSNSGDFSAVYAASRAWMRALNPYDSAVLARAWNRAGGPADQVPDPVTSPSVYPIPIFPLLSPIAIFSWPTARLIWCGINLLAMGALLECVRRLAGFRWSRPRMLLLAAIALMLRPMSSAVALGQMSLMVTALGAMAMVIANNSRGAGVLQAIGLALKAPLAAAFVVPDVMARRWKPLLVTFVVLLILIGVAVWRAGGPDQWMPGWLHNLQAASATGGVNDPSTANPFRHQLINLQYPLATSIANPMLVNGIALIIALLLAIPALIRLRSGPIGAALLLPLGLICLAEVLAVYHRMYDATVLIFPLAWALLPTTPRWQRWPALLLLAVFVAPGSGPLLNGSGNQLWVWNHLILPRDALAVFALAVWLAWCQMALLYRARCGRGRAASGPLAHVPMGEN